MLSQIHPASTSEHRSSLGAEQQQYKPVSLSCRPMPSSPRRGSEREDTVRGQIPDELVIQQYVADAEGASNVKHVASTVT